MTYQVLLSRQPTNGYTATALGWPNCQVTASTREAALQQIQSAIADLLTTSEVVDLEMPTPAVAGSYADTFGMFQDDPYFDRFLDEVNQYRQTRDHALVE